MMSPAMKATEFEYRHQRLVHQFIVGISVLMYLIDPDDVVWRFVKDSSTPHGLERFVFIVATLFIAVGAGICTRARARRPSTIGGGEPYRSIDQRHLGDLCYAIGLASLVPLSGFVILVGGEALRILRLVVRNHDRVQSSRQHSLPEPAELAPMAAEEIHFGWRKAVRQEAVKWGILVTMIIFVITLRDRYADVLAAASFLFGNLLNARMFSHSRVEEYETDP